VKTIHLPSGSRGIDTVSTLTPEQCAWLKAERYDFVVRYVTSLGAIERDAILRAGLALGLVTYAHSYDPKDEIAAIQRLGIPPGTDIWLDVEDDRLDAVTLSQRISSWATAIKQGVGCIPGVYVGSGNPLSSVELYALPVNRYWHSCSRVVDRHGLEAAPSCGWVMHQLAPGNVKLPNGLVVDIDVIQADYKGRQVSFVDL
jgi:hypothetical protein